MSESARSIHRQAQQILADERRRAEKAIADLQARNRKEIERLEKEHARDLLEYNTRLIELEKKQQQALATLEQRIDEEAAREEAFIRSEMVRLQRDTEAKLQQQKEQFEAELRAMYAVIDRRVNEVLAKIAEMEKNEKELAYAEVNKAISEYNALTADRDAKLFQGKTIQVMLKPMVEESDSACRIGSWQAAIGKALVAQVECKRCKIDAENDRKEWDKRFQAVLERLEDLEKRLAVLDQDGQEITVAQSTWHGRLADWARADYDQLMQSLAGFREKLMRLRAGDHGGLTNLELNLIDWSRSHWIERLSDRIEKRIQGCLSIYNLMLGAWHVTKQDWHTEMESDFSLDQPTLHGFVRLVNDLREQLMMNIHLDPQALRDGHLLLRLQAAYHGTRLIEDLENSLDEVLNALADAVKDAPFGYLLRCDGSTHFRDAEDFPACIIEFKPSLSKDDHATVPPPAPAAGAGKPADDSSPASAGIPSAGSV